MKGLFPLMIYCLLVESQIQVLLFVQKNEFLQQILLTSIQTSTKIMWNIMYSNYVFFNEIQGVLRGLLK